MAEFVGGEIEVIKRGQYADLHHEHLKRYMENKKKQFESKHCDENIKKEEDYMNKVYRVCNNEHDEYEIKECDIIFENKADYFTYNKEFDRTGRISKNDIITTNGEFKKLYCDEFKVFSSCLKIFANEELAEEYIKATKKYGSIWKYENGLEELKKSRINAENKLKEIDKNIEEFEEKLSAEKTKLARSY